MHNFLSTLPFSLLPFRAKRKMCLLSPYQQHGHPSELTCAFSELSWNENIWEPLPWSPSSLPTPPPTPVPPVQLPGSFRLPVTERISEALGGLHTHSCVQERPRPHVCTRGSQQGCWPGIPARIKSGVPLTRKEPMSQMQMAAGLSVLQFRKSQGASSEILACGYHRSLEVVRDKQWGKGHSLSFFSLVMADPFLLISIESRDLQPC